jgi:hypothetical protein
VSDTPVVRECPLCNQVDDHPRHVFHLPGDAVSARHMDCCAATGCDVCAVQIRDADGAQGHELRGHLVAMGA